MDKLASFALEHERGLPDKLHAGRPQSLITSKTKQQQRGQCEKAEHNCQCLPLFSAHVTRAAMAKTQRSTAVGVENKRARATILIQCTAQRAICIAAPGAGSRSSPF